MRAKANLEALLEGLESYSSTGGRVVHDRGTRRLASVVPQDQSAAGRIRG